MLLFSSGSSTDHEINPNNSKSPRAVFSFFHHIRQTVQKLYFIPRARSCYWRNEVEMLPKTLFLNVCLRLGSGNNYFYAEAFA
ncbi:MAG: hypothetical protein A3G49_04105 [Candidatus Sungbacteria bacterium RIFCSPLOWO2_12_FULL_41_11]|uniref:Uncharacterized protein n=1 Tax=Candidatus Sungbacteria bacterium RIFCSPLOWO2_12_FULL_41_11 TaxID=1802286 RepID=A0A1G2LT97_9BACT|nr:MAG: hypothetical protein A3D41_02575 [Candidatus Sungbacteria bacterium RIFCSPHIGHO2_02_FULL_41_12b]OHA14846.1 MAG: hypothetical protein A3G49_04105 [Candidatus Sungbacteria bacterium RIFCSPLOWO2_12_FULL_41_11]